MPVWVFPGLFEAPQTRSPDLLDRYPEWVAKAESPLGVALCDHWSKPAGSIGDPALEIPLHLLDGFLRFQAEKDRTGTSPDFLIGFGFAALSALCASGAISLEEGLKLARIYGTGLARCGKAGTISVKGLRTPRLQNILRENELSHLVLSGYLGTSHHFLSGPLADLNTAEAFLAMEEGVEVQFIHRQHGLFSRHVLPAQQVVEAELAHLTFSPCTIEVLAATEATPFIQANLKPLFLKQITRPLRWDACKAYFRNQGQTELAFLGPAPLWSGIQNGMTEKAPAQPVSQHAPAATPSSTKVRTQLPVIEPESLGCPEFRRDYGIRYAYLAGAMYKGIASKALVIRMAKAGLIGYFGAGGLSLAQLGDTIHEIQSQLQPNQSFGMNLLHNPTSPETEAQTVDLYLKTGVRFAEAASYIKITPDLVRYRLTGLRKIGDRVVARNHVLAKVSRPEVAIQFMEPAPAEIVGQLAERGLITQQEAQLAREIPLSHDICVESDSGGHTDQGIALVLLPAMCRLRDQVMDRFQYAKRIRVGAAGGIGTPEAAAAVFTLGAAFILTGSINQCTVEAGISDAVKAMLQNINVQDTSYAPAPDFFEVGGKVQVVGKGSFFSARANKLHQLYQRYDAFEDIDEPTRNQIQNQFFGKSFEEVWQETRDYYRHTQPEILDEAERHPKQKMALVFKWYYVHTGRAAMSGDPAQKYNYQVHCGPALGSFNQWVQGTDLAAWRNRHVDEIGIKLMQATAKVLTQRMHQFLKPKARD